MVLSNPLRGEIPVGHGGGVHKGRRKGEVYSQVICSVESNFFQEERGMFLRRLGIPYALGMRADRSQSPCRKGGGGPFGTSDVRDRPARKKGVASGRPSVLQKRGRAAEPAGKALLDTTVRLKKKNQMGNKDSENFPNVSGRFGGEKNVNRSLTRLGP